MAGIKVYRTNLPKQVQSIKTARLSALFLTALAFDFKHSLSTRPGLGFKSRGGTAGRTTGGPAPASEALQDWTGCFGASFGLAQPLGA
ncbi:hypothetical protein HGRIS_006779 [Hohenbuehelia grisea]|uniref:Uncharacterized protein n=1 Tax=Hohenbuehelia grisea TaxID=104357 RepID=A0ABR3J9Z8_9AGAR